MPSKHPYNDSCQCAVCTAAFNAALEEMLTVREQVGREEKKMDWKKFWRLFHHAWGQAKVSPEYEKAKFNEMQVMLSKLEKNERNVERRESERRVSHGKTIREKSRS